MLLARRSTSLLMHPGGLHVHLRLRYTLPSVQQRSSTMAEYVDIEQAKTLSGLRIVLPPGRPNPWGEALKGMCYVKKIPYTRVRKAQGHDAALQAWTSQSSAPAAVWN